MASQLNLYAREPLLRSRYQPVEQAMVELIALTKDVAENPRLWSPRQSSDEQIKRGMAERKERLEKFNEVHLRPYTWHIELIAWGKGAAAPIPLFSDLPDHRWATEMFRLIQLARVQLLDRIRKCAHCGIWFFATKPWAIFHDPKCRKAAARSEPGFQERHRKYQGNYFRKKLSVNQKYYKAGLSPAQVRALKKRKSSNKKSRRAA